MITKVTLFFSVFSLIIVFLSVSFAEPKNMLAAKEPISSGPQSSGGEKK
jgi:hypothetical protein